MNKTIVFLAALFVLALTGCGQRPSKAGSDETRADQSPGGRPETKTLQAAGLVGYDGKQIQRSVDKILDAKDQRNKELEDALHKTDDE